MTDVSDHGQLMDETYRYQRLIYDLTRKYYLLGRDHLISNMHVASGARVLEVACGTGRNLALIRKRYPQARLYGLDISEQMLATATAKLGDAATLAKADACDFDPAALFEVSAFDHVVLSYSLSMIPDWSGALQEAQRHLAPNGQVHVVDFGSCEGLPRWFERGLHAWLARFHVTPREGLPDALEALSEQGGTSFSSALYRGYAFYGRYQVG